MAHTSPADNLMSIAETAQYLGVATQTLYRLRHEGKGPLGTRVGGAVRYRKSQVDAWLDENTETSPGAA